MSKIKQVMVMREDLGMSSGKLAAQTAHASQGAADSTPNEVYDDWRRSGVTKIVLGGWSQDEIISIYKRAIANYLPAALITDEGRTEVAPGTITGVGIGPATSEQIDKITGHLSLYGKGETESY